MLKQDLTAQELLRQWLTQAQKLNLNCHIDIQITHGRTYQMEFWQDENDLSTPFRLIDSRHIMNGRVLTKSLQPQNLINYEEST